MILKDETHPTIKITVSDPKPSPLPDEPKWNDFPSEIDKSICHRLQYVQMLASWDDNCEKKIARAVSLLQSLQS